MRCNVEGMKNVNEQFKYTVEQRDGEQVYDSVRLWPGRRVVITYVCTYHIVSICGFPSRAP